MLVLRRPHRATSRAVPCVARRSFEVTGPLPGRWGSTHDFCALKHEMVRPHVGAGMKERDDFVRLEVQAGEIGPLVRIAPITRQGQLVRMVSSAMLFGDDVLNVKGDIGSGLLRHATILACVAGAPSDKLARPGIHASLCGGRGTNGP